MCIMQDYITPLGCLRLYSISVYILIAYKGDTLRDRNRIREWLYLDGFVPIKSKYNKF